MPVSQQLKKGALILAEVTKSDYYEEVGFFYMGGAVETYLKLKRFTDIPFGVSMPIGKYVWAIAVTIERQG